MRHKIINVEDGGETEDSEHGDDGEDCDEKRDEGDLSLIHI